MAVSYMCIIMKLAVVRKVVSGNMVKSHLEFQEEFPLPNTALY